jgi:hypothetical protein
MFTTEKHAGRADVAQPTMIGFLRKDTAHDVKGIVKKIDATTDIRIISDRLKDDLLTFQSDPCVVLLQISSSEEDEFDAVEDFLNRNPHLSVIIICDDVPFEQVRRLMRSGALDILPRPLKEDEFLVALEAAFVRVSNVKVAGGGARTGKVITFMKACGGVGGTTLAVQAAHALVGKGRKKKKICLIDFDLQFGNVAMYLDLEEGGEDRYRGGAADGVVIGLGRHRSGSQNSRGRGPVIRLRHHRFTRLLDRMVEADSGKCRRSGAGHANDGRGGSACTPAPRSAAVRGFGSHAGVRCRQPFQETDGVHQRGHKAG